MDLHLDNSSVSILIFQGTFGKPTRKATYRQGGTFSERAIPLCRPIQAVPLLSRSCLVAWELLLRDASQLTYHTRAILQSFTP
jgi:hypothetical protein